MLKIFTTLLLLFIYLPAEAGTKKISGEAEVSIAEDLRTKKSEMIYTIRDSKTGKSQRLQFKAGDFPLWFKTGRKIDVVVEETAKSSDAAQVVSIAESGTVAAAEFVSPYVTAVRKVLIMRLNAPEGPAYLSAETVLSAMYSSTNSVANFYLKSTRGKFTFAGDGNNDGQPDILDVNLSVRVSDACSYDDWANLANAEATKQGFNLSSYQHFAYVLPSQTVKCYWSGLGNVSGSRSWYRYGNSFAHELAHNIGLHHASNDFNNDEVFEYEYGDGSSMPNGTNFNSVYTERLGLLSAWPNQTVISGAGVQSLTALGADPNTALFPQIIKIKKGSTGAYYYLSLRTAAGMDSPLGADYVGVSVHTYGSGRSLWIKTLKPGEVFEDAVNGISVTALSYSSDGQAIGIDVKAICNSAEPVLTLSSSSVFANVEGKAVMNWALKNNDSINCPATDFSFSVSSAAAASFSYLPLVKVAAGSVVSGSISIQASLANGPFGFSVSASDTDGKTPDHQSVSVAASVAFDVTAPTAVQLSGSYSKGTAKLSWSSSTDTESGVAEYRIYRNGLLAGSTTALYWSESNLEAGSYSYSVVATDRAGNVSSTSAQVVIIVKAKGAGRR